jgi:hypothetical protein
VKEPSVKGVLVVGAAVAVRRHRDRGGVTPEQISARLGGPALELLDQKIEIGRWYPVGPFCELIDFDWERAGGRDPDYMRREGARAADHLFERGLYQQLDYAQRAERVQSRDALLRRARLITTVTGTLYNFLDVRVQVDPTSPDRLEIRYGNASAFSEALRYTSEGFMNQINRRQGSLRSWTSTRAQPDLVLFHMPLPSRLAKEG